MWQCLLAWVPSFCKQNRDWLHTWLVFHEYEWVKCLLFCRDLLGNFCKWANIMFISDKYFFPLLLNHKIIINFARAQRLGWYGHIEGMQETRMVKAVRSWKPISKRPRGRPKICWEDDVKKDIQKLKVPNCKSFVQDRRRWKEVVEKALRVVEPY